MASTNEAASSLPPCRVLVRSKQRLELFTVGRRDERTVLLDNCASTIPVCTAPDGSFTLVHIADVGIAKCDLPSVALDAAAAAPPSEPVAFFHAPTTGVQMMDLSPSGRKLLTWERWNASQCTENMRVWDTATGKLLAAFTQKNLSRESWPYLQWSMDESHAFLLVTNSQVRVFTASDLVNAEGGADPRFTDKLQIPCTTLSVHRHAAIGSPSKKYYFTTFSTKTKDKPAVTGVYEYSPTSKFVRLATKSVFLAEECATHWSPGATTPACLLTLQTAVDATGQSYYGNSLLWLWSEASDKESLLAVPLPQEGPVQACQWLPDPDKPASFIVIAGKIPPMTSQHHGVTGAVTFLFGNNVHRNTIAISPHARFVCLAGFGNLAGGMGFWDVNKKKLLPHSALNANGTLRSEAVTMHGWSPDSRLFLSATTAPRMNVDNGVRLYKYTGELVPANALPWNNANYLPNSLLGASFVPSLRGVYPDRPQSPVIELPIEADATLAPTVAATDASKPAGRYVPPSARNRVGGSSLAERLRKEKEGKVQGATKVVSIAPTAATAATGSIIPGLSVAASAKSKSQIKREKLKQKKEKTPSVEETIDSSPAVEKASEQSIDPEKRARKLKKILCQIDDLKLISNLNDDQKAKVSSEALIRAELEQLGL